MSGSRHRDTIAAIATGPSPGPLGIVRISGPTAFAIAERVFQGSVFRARLRQSHRVYYGRLCDPLSKDPIDEALLTTFRAPKSYTGEDTVELSVHGSPFLLSSALDAVICAGARQATPGEFTFRAFSNGRMDLAQAEAVADLIAARSALAAQAALRLREGGLSHQIRDLRERLLAASATIEMILDSDDDDVPCDAHDLRALLVGVRESVAGLLRSFSVGRVVRDGFKVAIVGRTNVGKSTLLNALAGRARAIVTSTPGTTRDLIEETVDLGGLAVTLIDTAGLRTPRGPIERQGIELALDAAASAHGVIVVLDATRRISGTDVAAIRKAGDRCIVVVWNKTDLVAEGLHQRLMCQPLLVQQGRPIAMVSAARRLGLEHLEEMIVHAALGGASLVEAPVVTHARHAEALRTAEAGILHAMSVLDDAGEPAKAAFDVREAADALGDILGITSPEDVVHAVFERFCVGK